MSPDQIMTAVVALLTGASDPDFDVLKGGGHDDRYPVAIENCPRPIGPLEIEGHTVICGRISVPENHDDTDGTSVPIAFAVLKARSESPAPDPVVYLHGGPGGYVVQDIPFNAGIFDFLRDRRDIVLFDQRASGISNRTVSCYHEFADDFIQFAKVGPELFSSEGPLAKCLAEVVDGGVDLSLYNTTQNARDVRAITQALGYPTYNAFGISYGTKLGQEMLRTAPDGLRSLVIDSISRVDNPAYDTNGVPYDQALGWVVDFCMEDPACAEAFPNLEADINAVGQRLGEEPKLVIAGKEVGPGWVYEFLDLSNTAHGEVTKYLPQVFTELAKGETTTINRLLGGAFSVDNSPAALAARLGANLNQTDRTVLEVLLMQGEQMRGLEGAVGKLLSALSNDLTAAGAADTEQLLDTALSDMAVGMKPGELLAMAQDYVLLIGQTPDRTAIETFVRTHVPDTEQARMLGIVAAMTEADVAAFFERADTDAAKLTIRARMMFSVGIYACQEDFPFNSREGFNAVSENYRFPVIEIGARDDIWSLYGFCDLFAHSPRAGYHEPVTSDLPVLAMSGTKDTQTNPDAAEMVVRTLTNAQAVLFPEAGHGVIGFSQCARDIAEAFIEHPGDPVNTACTQALKPDFFIPAAVE